MSERACRILDALWPVLFAWIPLSLIVVALGLPLERTWVQWLDVVILWLLISVLLLLATMIARRVHRWDGLAVSLTFFFVTLSLTFGRGMVAVLWPHLEIQYPEWNDGIRNTLRILVTISGLAAGYFIADLPDPDRDRDPHTNGVTL
jgi:hypothetical protein